MTEYKKLQKNTNWPYLETPLNYFGFQDLPISSEFFPGIGIDSYELMKVMEHEVFDANEKFEKSIRESFDWHIKINYPWLKLENSHHCLRYKSEKEMEKGEKKIRNKLWTKIKKKNIEIRKKYRKVKKKKWNEIKKIG